MIPGYGSTRLKEETISSTTAVANTITVKADLVRVTGTTAVNTILHPLMLNRGGLLIFIYTPDAGLPVGTGAGNILSSQTLAQNKLYAYAYSAAAGKWIPAPL